MSALISVIVPVYNAEKYLARCVDSVLGQSYTDLELILVDDGSADASGAICDEYAARDARVRVIHRANGGVSAARNDGMEAARGEWMAFCDNDDFYASGMLERLVGMCLDTDSDIAQCRPARGTAESLPTPPPGPVRTMTGRGILEAFYTEGSLYVWDKLCRREVWAGIRFPEGSRMHEDNAIVHRLYGAARRVALTDECLYYHYRNPQSVVGSGFDERWGADDPYADRMAYARAENLPRLLAETAPRRVYHEGFLLSMNRRYGRKTVRSEFRACHKKLMLRYYSETQSTPGVSARDRMMMWVRVHAPLLYHAWAWLKWRVLRGERSVRFGEIK